MHEKIADYLSSLPELESSPANSTNGTTTPSMPDMSGYMPIKDVLMVLGGITSFVVLAGGAFYMYRRRALKKIREAGNVQISLTRGVK